MWGMWQGTYQRLDNIKSKHLVGLVSTQSFEAMILKPVCLAWHSEYLDGWLQIMDLILALALSTLWMSVVHKQYMTTPWNLPLSGRVTPPRGIWIPHIGRRGVCQFQHLSLPFDRGFDASLKPSGRDACNYPLTVAPKHNGKINRITEKGSVNFKSSKYFQKPINVLCNI